MTKYDDPMRLRAALDFIDEHDEKIKELQYPYLIKVLEDKFQGDKWVKRQDNPVKEEK